MHDFVASAPSLVVASGGLASGCEPLASRGVAPSVFASLASDTPPSGMRVPLFVFSDTVADEHARTQDAMSTGNGVRRMKDEHVFTGEIPFAAKGGGSVKCILRAAVGSRDFG